MALIQIGKDTFKDTDDLEQREYHYFRKAEDLGRPDVAKRILLGYLDAYEIDTNPEFEWLRAPGA